MAKSCVTVIFTYSVSTAILNIDRLFHHVQGSVATRLRCGGIFKYDFVTNFLLSLTVKKFGKSVNISQSYGQEYSMCFYRAMLCIRGTSHGPVSVCKCLSQVGVLLKRLNVGSHKQHHTIAQGL